MPPQKKKASAPKTRAPGTRAPGTGSSASNQMPRWGRIIAISVGVMLMFAVLAYMFPVRSYVNQRNRITVAEKQLDLLRTQTKILRDQKKLLETPAEIERIARDRFGMVRPGEQPWAVVPGATGASGSTSP